MAGIFEPIRLVLTDMDGVLTPGSILLDGATETGCFSSPSPAGSSSPRRRTG